MILKFLRNLFKSKPAVKATEAITHGAMAAASHGAPASAIDNLSIFKELFCKGIKTESGEIALAPSAVNTIKRRLTGEKMESAIVKWARKTHGDIPDGATALDCLRHTFRETMQEVGLADHLGDHLHNPQSRLYQLTDRVLTGHINGEVSAHLKNEFGKEIEAILKPKMVTDSRIALDGTVKFNRHIATPRRLKNLRAGFGSEFDTKLGYVRNAAKEVEAAVAQDARSECDSLLNQFYPNRYTGYNDSRRLGLNDMPNYNNSNLPTSIMHFPGIHLEDHERGLLQQACEEAYKLKEGNPSHLQFNFDNPRQLMVRSGVVGSHHPVPTLMRTDIEKYLRHLEKNGIHLDSELRTLAQEKGLPVGDATSQILANRTISSSTISPESHR